MKAVKRTTKFKKDYKRELKQLAELDNLLRPIIESLVQGDALPVRTNDHALSGNWKGFRECHVKPDLLLIYTMTEEKLSLIRLGSHSELF